ncbi:MAG: phosphotransacetylase family protein [Thermosynechococcaceae cyanobacterium]
MPYPAKPLLIGSVAAYSGKSAAILGLVPQIAKRGFQFAYGKPLSLRLGTAEAAGPDLDVQFIVSALSLTESQRVPSMLTLSESDILQQLGDASTVVSHSLPRLTPEDPALDLLLLEGPGTLSEGQLFGFSLLNQAEQLDAAVLLMARCQSLGMVDELLAAQSHLGDRLYGVILNDIPPLFAESVARYIVPYLEKRNIPVFGQIPSHPLLRSISVREIVHQLKAEVLCCSDRLNLMVEQLTIGAMNVNSALRYFNRASNMAVVTGGDRTDIQLAALEASTNCLILTGHFLPNSIVINRAEDLEVPILSVDLDTLTTVELVDKAFMQARFSETIKVDCIQQLFKKHVDVDRLLDRLNLKPPVQV